MANILIVDDDDGLIQSLRRLFSRDGHDTAACRDGAAALQRLAAEPFDAIFLDHKLPGLDGLETLREIKRGHVKTPVIIMTGHGTTETAIEAMKLGAYDYLLKPLDTDELRRIAADALEVNRLMREVAGLSDAAARLAPAQRDQTRIVGTHRTMQAVFKLVGQIAEKDVTVLITGESGTGKELVARAISRHSRRKDKPFMAVNCASIPDTLVESEVFGYQQGAFTGADRTYPGRFERCDGGTLFFDEIGDMSLATQAKLLRVLQDGRFERVGGAETIQVNVRVLAATNKNLEEEVAAGRFREDLYYRLKIISIHLPPLRERLDDVPALVSYFVARLADEYRKPLAHVSDEAILKLRSHRWPGNVRQLENCLRRAVLTCQGDVLTPDAIHLEAEQTPPAGQTLRRKIDAIVPEILATAGPGAHASVLDAVEKALIARALDQCRHNQVHTARLLGISRNTLRHRIKKYGLESP